MAHRAAAGTFATAGPSWGPFSRPLSFAVADAILASAAECDLDLHEESQWNCAVHYPLLKLALQGCDGRIQMRGWYVTPTAPAGLIVMAQMHLADSNPLSA